MLLFAAALLLSGCNSEAGSQENGKSQDMVEASDITDKTDSFVKDSEEGAEVSTDVAEATDSTISDGSTETVAGSGEIQNSKKFEDYWDFENNAFDMEHYLESTNPCRLLTPTEDRLSFIAMYGDDQGKKWCIGLSELGISIYNLGNDNMTIFKFTPIWVKDVVHTHENLNFVYLNNTPVVDIDEDSLKLVEKLVNIIIDNPSSADYVENKIKELGINDYGKTIQ